MRRRHLALVQNFTKTLGGVGQAKYDTPDGDPIPVPCNAHPLSVDEIVAGGLQEVETLKLFADTWPGNMHSRITFRNAEWDQVAPPQQYDISENARSVQIAIKKRG